MAPGNLLKFHAPPLAAHELLMKYNKENGQTNMHAGYTLYFNEPYPQLRFLTSQMIKWRKEWG